VLGKQGLQRLPKQLRLDAFHEEQRISKEALEIVVVAQVVLLAIVFQSEKKKQLRRRMSGNFEQKTTQQAFIFVCTVNSSQDNEINSSETGH
jgi:hypothetical protein